MWQTLAILRQEGVLSDTDVELARLLAELDPEASWAVVLGACLASRAPQRGETCLDLAAQAGRPIREEGQPVTMAPTLASWHQALASSPVVGGPGEFRPLIREGNRLYLKRYWDYEDRIAKDLSRRAGALAEDIDEAALQSCLDRLFPPSPEEGPDWQKVAAAVAVLRKLTLITGGPGTGKTTTVTRLLATLLEQPGGLDLRIALTAPTGKAAARMQETIRRTRTKLPLGAQLKERLPDEARTLHRLLGARIDSVAFRHNGDNPLPFDVVVVDEASMVDGALFAKLLDAVPSTARLILIGDRDQLAPVEAGAVLPEITATEEPGFSPGFAAQIARLTGPKVPVRAVPQGLGDCHVQLQNTYRFGQEGGLEPLIRSVKTGDAETALGILRNARYPEVVGKDLPGEEERGSLIQALATRFRPLLEAAESGDPETAFAAYWRFGVLDALRQGPLGSEALNQQIEATLRRQERRRASGTWYPGRPVLITQNDYRLDLFNGDIGIALDNSNELRVHFETSDGAFRALAPNRLPPFERAFVLTVHKSQGSEFERVELLVPESAIPSLGSRELIYTGLSRARHGLTLHTNEATLRRAVSHPLNRASGLGAKMEAQTGKE